MNVLYLCDRKACDECNHTQDINHAKNYQKAELDTYFETLRLPLNLVNLKPFAQQKVLNELLEQLTTGIVILPEYIECVYSPPTYSQIFDHYDWWF